MNNSAAISSGLVDLFPKEVKRSFDNKKVNVLAFNESKFWFALYSDGNSRGGLKTGKTSLFQYQIDLSS